MTASAFLELKQRASKLSEQERRRLSAYLIKLGQERPAWKRETSRRLDDMAKGNKISVAGLIPNWVYDQPGGLREPVVEPAAQFVITLP